MKQTEKTEEKRKSNRIWELDTLRGILIICVLCTHLYYTVDAFFINGYYTKVDSYAYVNLTDPLHFWFDWGEDGVIYKAFMTDQLRSLCVRTGVDVFFLLSGICCLLSRSNLKRGLKLLAGALMISGFTKLIAVLSGEEIWFIRFGVLHCYAYCHLIYYFLLEKRSDKVLLATALPSLAFGYYLRYVNPISSESVLAPLLYPLGIQERNAPGRDYWPIFPMLGWMLLGVVLGRKIYASKHSRFPEWKGHLSRFLQLLGRHSGMIYIGHIFIYTALFCGAGEIFHLY